MAVDGDAREDGWNGNNIESDHGSCSDEEVVPVPRGLRTRMSQHRKSLKSIMAESMHDQAAGGAKLSLFDLLCIGIGSTIGSGVFVLTGKALPEAGPAAVLSWLLAGFICLLSSFSYMELSARLPTKGSCYVFSYHGLGELAGIVGAVCLTLEYGISGSGIARSWSAKFTHMLGIHPFVCYNGKEWGNGCDGDDDYYLDPIAAGITLLSTAVVAGGMDMGKLVINSFTIAKISLVAFMTIAGFSCWTGNMFESTEKFVPHGATGVLKSTASLFFGFIGFDEVCCMASKAKNPSRTMPRALIGTLVGAATFSGLAQTALAAMVPYTTGMAATSFEDGFKEHGLLWAKWIVGVGECALLPLVVLLSVMPQPEVTAAMSEDGLLPSVFSRQNRKGVYFEGTWIVGIALTLVSFAVPFAVLWDIISIGVLLSFNLTNASLIQVRYGNGGSLAQPYVDLMVWTLFICTTVAGYMAERGIVRPLLAGKAASVGCVLLFAATALASVVTVFTLSSRYKTRCDMNDPSIFKAPCVPFLPALAMFCNMYLISQFKLMNWAYFAVLLLVFVMTYIVYLSRRTRKEGKLADSSDNESADSSSNVE